MDGHAIRRTRGLGQFVQKVDQRDHPPRLDLADDRRQLRLGVGKALRRDRRELHGRREMVRRRVGDGAGIAERRQELFDGGVVEHGLQSRAHNAHQEEAIRFPGMAGHAECRRPHIEPDARGCAGIEHPGRTGLGAALRGERPTRRSQELPERIGRHPERGREHLLIRRQD